MNIEKVIRNSEAFIIVQNPPKKADDNLLNHQQLTLRKEDAEELLELLADFLKTF